VNRSPNPGKRLAVVLSHPTQYYSPWFRWLGSHCQIEFRVFYLWNFGVSKQLDPRFGTQIEWDVDLLSGYDSIFVPNTSASPGAEHFLGFRNPELARRLEEWSPQALLLFGYKWASHMRAVAWARCHRVPILFRGDSHLIGRGAPALHVRIALRALFSQFASFLYVGQANRDYFESFGVPPHKLFFAPHSVDGTLFDRGNQVHKDRAERLRSRLGLDRATRVVLFAGKLVPEKQPLELLRSFLELRLANTALVVVGDGPEKARLQAIAGDLPLGASGSQVRFVPIANQSEMPSIYLLADLFVLPSRGFYETWGLSVNEAMHMGTPCLVSNRVGCQRDLVTEGETGWVFDPEDPRALGVALSAALTQLGSPSRREQIERAIDRRMAGYTYEKTADGLLAALASLPSEPTPTGKIS
jgi:glycosyltransferase involved in cell wall biosynthesis